MKSSNKIAASRKTIRDAFASDEEFKRTYLANIAMLLYDELGLTAEERDRISEKLLKLIFD